MLLIAKTYLFLSPNRCPLTEELVAISILHPKTKKKKATASDYRLLVYNCEEYILGGYFDEIGFLGAEEDFLTLQIGTEEVIGIKFLNTDSALKFAVQFGSMAEISEQNQKTIAKYVKEHKVKKDKKKSKKNLPGQTKMTLNNIANTFNSNLKAIKNARLSVAFPDLVDNLSVGDLYEQLHTVFLVLDLERDETIPRGKIVSRAIQELAQAPQTGKCDDEIVSQAKGLDRYYIEVNLADRISNDSSCVSSLAVQIASLVSHITNLPSIYPNWISQLDQVLIQYAVLVQCFIREIIHLLVGSETLKCVKRTELTETTPDFLKTDDDVNIWDDKDESFKIIKSEITRGTLNDLVTKLTDVNSYDNQFLHTFMTTYRSFSSCAQLFQKLKQQYRAPSLISEDTKKKIQLRVLVVIKYWIENQFADFDDTLLKGLSEFLEETLNDGHLAIGKSLSSLLEKKEKERRSLTQVAFVQQKLMISIDGSSLLEIFQLYSAEEIAQQLTLLDFEYYQNIQVTVFSLIYIFCYFVLNLKTKHSSSLNS